MLQATQAASDETYLGCPINVSRPSNLQPIVARVEARLNMWKARVLSQAGKVILIRSVIESTLLYYMTTTSLHKSVIAKIQSAIKRFHWGGKKNRYLAYLRWEVVTAPKERGGLGIRDLHLLNKALVMKKLWKLVVGSKALWVGIMPAKYHPNGALWHTNRTYQCTQLWRTMMEARETLAPALKWVVGDGEMCRVFSQPWFEFWRELKPANKVQRELRICNLLNPQTDTWDEEKLYQTLGYFHTRKVI